MKTILNTAFAESIIEEFTNLHIIAFNEDSVLAVDFLDSNKAHFFYEVNEDVSFHFNMLCEVGARYQAWFEETIKELNYKLASIETATDYFDTLSRL